MSNNEKYFGVKEILIPDNTIYTGNLLVQCQQTVETNRLLHTLKSFEGEQVVIIYTVNDKNWLRDDLIDCMFVSDYLKKVSDAKNVSDTELIFDNHSVRLNRVVDIISQAHLKRDARENLAWKLFTFGVSDDKTDLYQIINVNPVLAYLDAEKNQNAPLKLYSITPIHAGMQFNRGKGAPDIDDVY